MSVNEHKASFLMVQVRFYTFISHRVVLTDQLLHFFIV